jgi:hypothetical protein
MVCLGVWRDAGIGSTRKLLANTFLAICIYFFFDDTKI